MYPALNSDPLNACAEGAGETATRALLIVIAVAAKARIRTRAETPGLCSFPLGGCRLIHDSFTPQF